MNSELKNNLIMALVGAILASAGFLVKGHFEAEGKKEKFVFELHKKLYDDGAASIKDLNRAYSELYALYSEGYGLTPSELSEKQATFRESLKKYSEYIDELERYGTTGQVEVAKSHIEWFWGIYSELELQYKTANRVQKRAKELLLIKDIESEYFDFVNKALESEVENLVRSENRLFYSVGWYKKPVVNGIEQYLNFQFREALGLPATRDMAKTINSLPELSDKSKSFEFKEKKLPFMFAEGRSFQAPTLEFQGEDDFFKEKNDVLAANVKMKFIASAIDSDKWLQEELKKRKIEADSAEES